jgi:hypothetical protein
MYALCPFLRLPENAPTGWSKRKVVRVAGALHEIVTLRNSRPALTLAEVRAVSCREPRHTPESAESTEQESFQRLQPLTGEPM